MTDRASILTFIEGRAAKLRAKSDSGEPGWAMARHDAWLLEAIASDIRAGLDKEGAE